MSETQPDLLPAASTAPQAPADPPGEYTLTRTLATRPDAVRIAAGLLSDGASILDTARICRMSPHTVMQIRERQAREAGENPTDTERESLSTVLRRGAFLCAETITERLQCPVTRAMESTRDLAQAVGIMVPQSELLAGRATARIALEGPTPADILAEMRDISQSVVIGPSRAPARTGQEAENQIPPRPAAAELHDAQADRQAPGLQESTP